MSDDPGPNILSLPLLDTSVSLGSDLMIVIVCLVLCAFFSGMEIAFISANRLRIELQSKKGTLSGKILSRYIKTPSDFISTVLVGNSFALVIYGIYVNNILLSFLNPNPQAKTSFLDFIITTVASTLLVLVTAEFIPKSLFRANADFLLNTLILPFRMIQLLLWPIVYSAKVTSTFLLRIFTKTRISESTPVFTKVDLDNYISSLEKSGLSESSEIDTEVFRNALDFSEVKVRNFMVPRTELVAVNIDESIEEVKNLFIKTSLSKLLIYRDNIDNIIGFVHQSDMFASPKKIDNVLKPVIITHEGVMAHDILREFIQKKRSIAIVLDEFGGTSGLVTIEDVIEEIFGEIEDEFDTEDLTETVVKPDHYIFSARLEIYYLNEKYHLNIPDEGDYSTLGGFIIFVAEKIPRQKEVIKTGNFEFIITKVKGAKIEEVELIIHND